MAHMRTTPTPPPPYLFALPATNPHTHKHNKCTQAQTRNTEKFELSYFSFSTKELERKGE